MSWSCQYTHDEIKRAWYTTDAFQKDTIRYLPYPNSVWPWYHSHIRLVIWYHRTSGQWLYGFWLANCEYSTVMTARSSYFVITFMITDRIGLHSVHYHYSSWSHRHCERRGRLMSAELRIKCRAHTWARVTVIFSKNTARLYEPKFVLSFARIAVLIVIIISTRVVVLRKWRHFFKFSTSTWNKESTEWLSSVNFSEIRSKKMSSYVNNRLKFAKVRKCKNLIAVAL